MKADISSSLSSTDMPVSGNSSAFSIQGGGGKAVLYVVVAVVVVGGLVAVAWMFKPRRK